MSSPLLLPQDTITRIKNQGANLITDEQNGSRKVSLSLVSASASRSSSASLVDETYISIPVRLESASTFEFLCYTAEKAKQIFDTLVLKQQETHTTLNIDGYATAHATSICDKAQDSTDDWFTVMKEAGIKDEIQTALMKKEHERIRRTCTLSRWIEVIIETNYLALVELNARILCELGEPAELPLRGGGEDEYTIPQMPGGHLAIFKSVEYSRASGCISEDGSMDLGRLESSGPTDFARRGGLYFTHQLWVARHYSALIHDACPVSDRRTVEIHVPLAHLDKVKTWDLKPDEDDSKRLLYFSRRDERYPKDISQKRAAHGVIQGAIAHTHNLAFAKMSSWQEVTEKHILMEDDEDGAPLKIAKQYVWIKEGAIEQLEEDCVGKVYLRLPEYGFRKELIDTINPTISMDTTAEDQIALMNQKSKELPGEQNSQIAEEKNDSA
ncbi:hypothetical protein A1F96_08279 [Pyrenophora tritici-repentis]|nr:hypothetical protein A1F96_08279 [Pyrenophora tritici-repentis]